MRGSAVFRTGVAPGGALAGPWVQNSLWTRARAVPSLDLRFADNKSLTDATTGANLVDFTRASSGTYVDSDGVIRTATTNLLPYSEEFDQYGLLIDASLISNSATAPNGTLSADKLIEDTSNSAHKHRFISTGADTSTTYSVYAKSAERDLVLNAQNPGSGVYRVYFNLSTGTSTVITNTSATGSHSITEIGDGWYRCSITYSFTESDAYYLDNSVGFSGSYTYTGDGTSGIYLWGAQLEQSATVGEYIPTTSAINSAPRFDHDPTTGESLGLLVEEARTNLLVRSEEFDDASWTKTRSSIEANTIVAPDGTLTGDKLVDTTNASTTHVITQSFSFVSGTTYTTTLYAKQGEIRYARLGFSATAFGAIQIGFFDLQDGVVTTTSGTVTTSITSVGNGWWRIRVSAAATVTTSDTISINLSVNGTSSSFTGNGFDGIYIWGAQLEEGSFPTSYIPTVAATVTRAADVASITGSNFSSWYRQDEGTFFWSGSMYDTQYSNQNSFRVTEGSNFRGIGIALDGRTGTDEASFVTRSGAGITAATSSIPYVIGNSNIRIGGAFGTDIAASFNGSTPFVASPAYVFGTENKMEIMGDKTTGGTNYQYNGHTRRLTFWPTRLSNEVLQRITQ